MKNTLLILMLFAILSCGSDQLSNSKAEKIIASCLDAKPEQRTTPFTIGKATFRDTDGDRALMQKYMALKEEGYIEMELIKEISRGWNKGAKEFSIKLAAKSLEYMEQVPENGNVAYAKTFKYVVGEVLEVHELPSLNSATVKVNFKATEITPFAPFSSRDPSEFWVKELAFTKTSNGWKYCDNF